jgi:hypothetical protein
LPWCALDWFRQAHTHVQCPGRTDFRLTKETIMNKNYY